MDCKLLLEFKEETMNRYDQIHLNTLLNKYGRDIQRIYENVIREAAAMGVTLEIDPTKPFSFKQFPKTNARVKRLFDKFEKQLQTYIENGIKAQWKLSNEKTNYLLTSYFAGITLTEAEKQRYFTNNLQARDAFIKRTQNGIGLSERIWRYKNQFEADIELALEIGIKNGESAAEIARNLKQYLNDPQRLYRKVRDELGVLRLSKSSKEYNSGIGISRSSYQNALRLARTEVNMAYKYAEHLRIKDLDFVLGIKISLSNNHTCNGFPFFDICDELAGIYPKTFIFKSWHPNCRCVVTTILAPIEEFKKNIKEKKNDYKEVAKELSPQFKDWFEKNKDRIQRASERNTLPYFIVDNIENEEIKNLMNTL